MSLRIRFLAVAILFGAQSQVSHAVPVDVDGDGIIGPQEAIDLSENWKGPAQPQGGGGQPWEISGSNIIYNGGNVGIGETSPQFPLTVRSSGYGFVQSDGIHEIGTYLNSQGGWVGTKSNHPLNFFTNDSQPRVTLLTNGNLGIGTAAPGHRLGIAGGPSWTTSAWSGSLELNNGAAIGWKSNSGGSRFGVGQTNGGLYFFRTASDPGTATQPPIYDMIVGDKGTVGLGGNPFDDTRLHVQGAPGFTTALFNTGTVHVAGNLVKNGGSFKIDHPLDPENKYLSHSFVESPDMMNIYNGNILLDDKGEAEILLPDWFMALNKDFRYQLTPIGAPGPNLFISKKIADGKFRISGGSPGGEVSWQVTGIRHDVWADANRVQVEEDKAGKDRGKYLTPEIYGQPKEMGIHYRPELAKPSEAVSEVE